MQTGTAIEAPEGYGELERGLTYYFLRSNRSINSAQFVLFTRHQQWLAHLYSLPRGEFEHCLLERQIVPVQSADGQPPFLGAVKGKNLLLSDLTRPNAKQAHTDRIEKRLLQIGPLLARTDQTLCASDPEREINRYANANGLNAQRIRFWFFAYLCFGQSSTVLFPHYFNCGRWDRSQQTSGPKWGRPSIARGKYAGVRMTAQMQEKIVKSYLKLRYDGRTMTSIYQEAMQKYFKAQITINEFNQKRLVSSDGSPIPTEHQYRYQLKKALGPEEIRLSRWGAPRYRRSKAGHKGKFASSVSNLLERTEADAYYCEDRPRNLKGDGHLQPLCITRYTDVASGLRIGIGFALGNENSESYHAALFCAAISKQKFCSLFGIEIQESDWPSQGLPAHAITDRGPGIKREPGHSDSPDVGVIIREATPSGQGQSKAIVESSQRRRTKIEGPNQYYLSDLSAYQLAVREIRRLLAENKSTNASGHMTPEMIAAHTETNPLGVWNFLDARARNDSQPVSFDDAVRRYLPKKTAKVRRDGVWLASQRYSSAVLLETKLLDRISAIGLQTITAYILPMCVRYIWVEINDRLIEVKAELNLRDDESMLYQSYDELIERTTQLNQLQAEHRINRQVATVDQQIKFQEENGADWHSTSTTRTRSTRSGALRAEEKMTQAVLGGKDFDND